MKQKHIRVLFLSALLMLGVTLGTKAQNVVSYSVTPVSGSVYHFSVTLDKANPNGRGVIAGWDLAWRYGFSYVEYTGAAFIMGPTGGTTYESDQDVNAWPPPAHPPAFFWADRTVPNGPVAFICDACLTKK